MSSLLDALQQSAATAPQAPIPFTPIPKVALDMPAFSWQDTAIDHVLTNGYGLIAYDMGTGKSIVGVGVAASVAAARALPVLIVCPPTLIPTWQHEFRRFHSATRVTALSGNTPYAIGDTDVLIIGDSVVAKWAPVLAGNISGIVVDESHNMKNRGAKRSKAVADIAAGIPADGVKCLLTGTPLPNGKHIELVGQLNILGHKAWDALGGYGNFWGTYWPKSAGNGWGGGGNANHDLLHERSRAFTLRCRREDVVEDLPHKGRNMVMLPVSGNRLNAYMKAQQNLYDYIRDLPISDEDKMRRISGAMRGRAIVLMNVLRRLSGEAKVPLVADRVKELLNLQNNPKVELPDGTLASPGVLIFAEHRSVMDELELKLLAYNPVTINGQTPNAHRQDMINAFVSGQSRVMIAHPKSAGVGLTLHGQGRNSHVIIAEQPWSPSSLVQAENRLHRMGQTVPVTVEVMVSEMTGVTSIDERMSSALHNKHLSASMFLDGEAEELLDVTGAVFESYKEEV